MPLPQGLLHMCVCVCETVHVIKVITFKETLNQNVTIISV